MKSKGIGRFLLLIALGGVVLGLSYACISTEQHTSTWIKAALARAIDYQMGPVDDERYPSEVNDNDGSHIGDLLEGVVNKEMVANFMRVIMDDPFSWGGYFLYDPASRGMLHEFEPVSAADSSDHSHDNNPCNQDLNDDSIPDYCDLCIDRCYDISCNQITDKKFRIKYNDCRWLDYYIWTSTTSGENNTIYSTAYWTLNGSVTYHYGTASIDEQIVEVDYDNMEYQLHDFVSEWAQGNWNLPDTWYRIDGKEMIYRVLNPSGGQATGTTGYPDGMTISRYDMKSDDDGQDDGDDDNHNQGVGDYNVNMVWEWEDGLLFLEGNKVVMPDPDYIFIAEDGGELTAAQIDWAVALVIKFYDKNYLKHDGLPTAGCTVVIDNIDDILRTFDMYGTGETAYGWETTCDDLRTTTGVRW